MNNFLVLNLYLGSLATKFMTHNNNKKTEDFLESEKLLILTLNTWIPYLYDVPVIIGYPISFQHRFRYKKQWLNDSVLNHTVGPNQMGLIVLRDSLSDFLL
jgi:hypothetical protein